MALRSASGPHLLSLRAITNKPGMIRRSRFRPAFTSGRPRGDSPRRGRQRGAPQATPASSSRGHLCVTLLRRRGTPDRLPPSHSSIDDELGVGLLVGPQAEDRDCQHQQSGS